ncbi:alpha-glucosidase [Lutibacter sp.]|uniref:alpha-glucosidase n=1 Tax=Lutibacter sp. TaxID=1925666 RepID=UPI0027373901|nr:alpha-glucosidase [Lutibacter sp.]MDP3313573.1 alpha-glucosidase [Lutibacter sp.]
MQLLKLIVLIPFLWMMTSCTNKSKADDEKIWWKETVFYEIYMPSYKDSNGDGFSDFKGLTTQLDYIENMGVKGIWLTPFLQSPKVDNGYDVSDYYAIDSTYGTMEDFKIFLNKAHKKNIKVIMDLVVNHTSTDSKWFQESKKSKESPYRDYYIWSDQPNNWESFFGGSAWELDKATNQYYYHQFDVKMADLNWGNPKVVKEIQDVLRFWLNLGVDGFRLDVINFLTTDGITLDNPTNEKGAQEHVNDINQKGVKEAMKIIRKTVNEFENRFIVGEIGSDKIEVLKQYQGTELLDVVFNFNFGSIPEFSAQRIFEEMQSMETNMTNFPTLFFGSHDMPRLISRLAKNNIERAEALAALMLTAKGIPFIYYGEEIGMENIEANSINEIMDIQGRTHYNLSKENGMSEKESLAIGNKHNRDKSRSPMQWNDSQFAGFSDVKPWIKVNSNYDQINVESLAKKENSILNSYKKLIALRNSEPVLQYGSYGELSISNNCINFIREYKGNKVKCYFNFGNAVIKIEINPKEKVLFGKTKVKPNNFLIVKQ